MCACYAKGVTDTTPPHAGAFATTRWSVVLTAGNATPEAEDALAALCHQYWYPLYAFVRRRGYAPHDAQDLTQEFFTRLIGKGWLGGVVRERGRFRSWLLTAMKNFLSNEWDRARAEKRGGGIPAVSFDELTAEQRYAVEPTDAGGAEKLYDRCWALQLLDRVLGRLGEEFEKAGKRHVFDALKATILGDAAPLAEIAAELDASEGAVKAAAHRLRQRYRELLRAEIAQTVPLAADIDDELRHLFSALAG
jgi:RNA polymerase sigma-70 factor (ECF subfamily)